MRPDRDALPWSTRISYLAIDAVARLLIKVSLALPYTSRLRFMGWIMASIAGPLAGYTRRARAHIAFAMPDLPDAEIRRIARASLNNAGRTLIENYSTDEFIARQKGIPIAGPGFEALENAAQTGRPVILVSGHFGNYEAVRAALGTKGYDIGGLYREMSNPYFNDHYVRTVEAFGGPVFAKGSKGTAGFVRHLKSGGQLVLLFDQHVHGAPALDFLGHPALTSVSAATLALRHDALLIPFYGLRKPDGVSFDIILEAPISHSDPETMTQTMNDSIAARIRANPGQWMWVARRWRARP